MSKAADIASLELIAAVHQVTKIDQETFEHLVHRLNKQVPHFEWVGLYLLDNQQYSLKATAGDQTPVSIARKAILQMPITSSCDDVFGKLMVTSSAVAFDESDYTSLEALAMELGKKMEQLMTSHQ